jgi:hypothetical protein
VLPQSTTPPQNRSVTIPQLAPSCSQDEGQVGPASGVVTIKLESSPLPTTMVEPELPVVASSPEPSPELPPLALPLLAALPLAAPKPLLPWPAAAHPSSDAVTNHAPSRRM